MTGNTVTPPGLEPEELLALQVAKSHVSRGEPIGPNVATVLISAIEWLTQSGAREHRYWLTEKAENALGGAR